VTDQRDQDVPPLRPLRAGGLRLAGAYTERARHLRHRLRERRSFALGSAREIKAAEDRRLVVLVGGEQHAREHGERPLEIPELLAEEEQTAGVLAAGDARQHLETIGLQTLQDAPEAL